MSYRFRFRSESWAESQAEDIEDYLDDTGWDIDPEEIKADGVSVGAKASADEEDFRLDWLGRVDIYPSFPRLPGMTGRFSNSFTHQ